MWHGTSTENLLSIMSKGLKIAPNDAASNGHRFGKGIYFSDSFMFSHEYSSGRKHRSNRGKPAQTNKLETRKYMLLCEVGLGKAKLLRSSHETVDATPPDGFDSVKVLGKVEPDPNQNVCLPNGCVVPLGHQVPAKYEPGENSYSRASNVSQYVIYNEAQCCIRYIIQYHSTN